MLHTIVLFNKLKVILMKKILAVLMVISIIFVFAGCSSKEYKDTVVTIPVTDENGKEVTDEAGKVVTEVVTERETDGTSSGSSSDNKTVTDDKTSTTVKTNSKTTTKKNSSKTTTTKNNGSSAEKTTTENNGSSAEKTTTADNKTDNKTTSSTTAATTEKPKNRKVSVSIVLPYYNDKETKLSVRFRAAGDKEYTKLELEDPADKKNKLPYETVKLDGKTVKTYELGEMKGDVTVRIDMTGVDVSNEVLVIPADESTGEMKPVTGIEIMQGEDF